MPFLIDDAYLPATLTAQPMTDEEFTAFCAIHPDLNFEMSAEGELIVMPPTHFDGGVSNSDVDRQLGDWAKRDRRGYVCDSSTGFVLPNGARRAPDVSWTLKSRVQQLGARKRKAFLHLCPDFVVELRSPSDRLPTLQAKMREWIDNGAKLGWLIDPKTRCVYIYRPGQTTERLVNPGRVEGESPIDGFTLEMADIWNPDL